METTKRLTHIDLIETIAIFFVLVYHSTLYTFDFAGNAVVDYASYFFTGIFSTCVPLFFFANGYLLFNRSFDLKKHMAKMVRILVVTLVWMVVLMPVYLLMAGEPLSIKTIVLSVLNMDAGRHMNVFWFMGALICLYIFFPALKALFDSNKKAFTLFTAVCALFTFGFVLANQMLDVLSEATHHSFGKINYVLFEAFNPFADVYSYSFVYFCVGGLMCTYEERLRRVSALKRNLISSVGIVISCGLLALVGLFYTRTTSDGVWDVVWNGYNTVFTFCNVMFIYTLSLHYRKDRAFIRTVSYNTLGIYFTHVLIINLTRPWIQSVEALCNLPCNLVYAFLVLCVCLCVCLLFKKIPILKQLV